MTQPNINIIWLDINLDKWEQDWLLYLLENQFSQFMITNELDQLPVDKPTVVIANHAINYRIYLDALRKNNKKYAVVLLSDENLIERMEYLHDPNCIFVARNYFNPNYLNHPKVVTFGLGYKNNFKVTKNCPTFNDRDLVWNFAGSFHDNYRRNVIETFKPLGPHKLHSVSGFNAADGLETSKYVKLLEESKFTLCPRGHQNNDCFRIYEALEAGSIPIVLAFAEHLEVRPSYWHAVFYGDSNMPFIVADSWPEAFEKVKNLLEEKRGAQVQKDCQEFWLRWKSNWKSMFADKIKKLNS